MKKYQISINRDKCIACGTCVNLLPEFFDLDDNDALVRLKNSKPEGDYFVSEIDEGQLKKFQAVIDSCPTQAITIRK